MLERGERLSQFPWPAFDAGAVASVLRWLLALVIVAALAWAARMVLRKRSAVTGER
jgi:hypothetical protein